MFNFVSTLASDPMSQILVVPPGRSRVRQSTVLIPHWNPTPMARVSRSYMFATLLGCDRQYVSEVHSSVLKIPSEMVVALHYTPLRDVVRKKTGFCGENSQTGGGV